MRLKKGERFLSQGDNTQKAGLVISGLLRQFYIDAKGRELTKNFITPGKLGIAYAEMLSGAVSRCFIEAVVDTELEELTHPQFNSMYEINENAQALGRMIAEANFMEKEQREFELLHYSALERYKLFEEKYSDYISYIPQKHIASYIGVTPVALSRLLRSKN